jgi:hypothetical protein
VPISFDSLWAHLASTSFFTAVVPIALGGITYFNSWLVSEDELRKRADLRKQALLEKANKRLYSVFSQFDLAPLDDLRGSPPEPDFISDFTDEFAAGLFDMNKLTTIYVCIRRSKTIFLVTAVIGLAGVLLALIFESARPYISLTCYLMVAVQIVVILMVRRWTSRFDECEGRS